MGPVGVMVVLGIVGIIGYALFNIGPANLKIRFAQAGQLAGRTKALGWTPPDGIDVPEWRC
jgi:hypothetical protein